MGQDIKDRVIAIIAEQAVLDVADVRMDSSSPVQGSIPTSSEVRPRVT